MSVTKKISNPVSWKPSIEVFNAMQEWLSKHPAFDKSKLLDMAIAKFIQEQQILEPVEIVTIDRDKARELAGRAMKKHKKALDRLK